VVDNSSAFRYDPGVPLVVPEVNGDLLDARPTLVANPNCSTIAIALALAPLQRAFGLERVAVSTYQAVSGGGSEALADLESGVRAGLEGPPPARAGGLPPFAFNVVPHIDRFEENGYTREEMKVVWETRKILGLPDLPVTATAVRVPVRVGHSAAVNARFTRPVSPAEARELWRAFPGLEVVDDPARGRYPTPLEAAGGDAVLVGRARRDLSQERALEFFVASDNLRKGAALNAVQIAERLARSRVSTP
jgi:aspartate-semialdehyde dehydrogenase